MSKRLLFTDLAREQLKHVSLRLRLEDKHMFQPMRIAFARSLQTRIQVDLNEERGPRKEGFQMDLVRIEQEDGLALRALLQQYYKCKLTDDEYASYVERHIEHGLDLIFHETEKFHGYEYLVALAKKGLHGNKENGLLVESDESPLLADGYKDVLSVHIGTNAATSQPVVINFNKTDEHANNYLGIVGKPGSGKTYFAKHFLTKLREVSRYETNFIIFDYAKGDIADDVEFIEKTQAIVLKVDKEPIPINPFITPDKSSLEQKRTAGRLVEIICNVETIGKVQEENLYRAIMNAYQQVGYEENSYPDFELVHQMLEEIKDTPDSLTSVFRPLIAYNLFAKRDMSLWDSLVNRTVIFDIHRVDSARDLCVFFILNEMYRQLMLLPDSKVDSHTKAREMRTVIVIDEAHHFLKSKKRVEILERLIREIRSKGASVMLLSQSPDDYDKTEFNFLELLEFVYVLQSNPSSHKFLEQAFGLSTVEAKKLMSDVTELKQGEAFGKSKDQKVTKLLLCK